MLALVALLAVSSPQALAPAKGSAIRFTAHQTFSQTDGAFREFSGTFEIDREDVSKSRVQVKIRAASIDTDNGSRDEHLRSDDFFDVEDHPTITFASSSIAATGEDRVKVKGTLTVKGKEVPVEFAMKLTWRDDGVDAYGRLTIDRRRIGITYDAPFYAPALKDNVNLELDMKLRPPGA